MSKYTLRRGGRYSRRNRVLKGGTMKKSWFSSPSAFGGSDADIGSLKTDSSPRQISATDGNVAPFSWLDNPTFKSVGASIGGGRRKSRKHRKRRGTKKGMVRKTARRAYRK